MSPMEATRIALIGAGGLAGVMHHPSLAEFEDVALVAVCDLERSRAQVDEIRGQIVDVNDRLDHMTRR